MAGKFLFEKYGDGLRTLTQKLESLSGKSGDGGSGGFTRRDAEALGEKMIVQMNEFIAKGISPIRDVGRFPGYKHQGVKGKYPDSVKRKYPGKRDRPVNLYLSSDFLTALRAKVVKDGFDWLIKIGWDSDKQRVKELGHREGANGQPRRPIIPKDGEQWAVTIQSSIIDAFKKANSR